MDGYKWKVVCRDKDGTEFELHSTAKTITEARRGVEATKLPWEDFSIVSISPINKEALCH